MRYVLTLAISVSAFVTLADAAERRGGWVRCTDGAISAAGFSDSEPLAVIGTREGEVVPVRLSEMECGDAVNVPGSVFQLLIAGESNRWFAASVDQGRFVTTIGSIDESGDLSVDRSHVGSLGARAGYLEMDPHGRFIASVAEVGDRKVTLEVLSVPELSPIFFAGEMDHGSVSTVAQWVGASTNANHGRVAFFGDGRFAFAARVGPRSSEVGVIDLSAPDDVTRLAVSGRCLVVSPSLCGKTFRIHHDRLDRKDFGSVIDRFRGDRSQPWERSLAFQRFEVTPTHYRVVGETDCAGSFAMLKFRGPDARRQFQLVHVSPGRTVILVERVRHGYAFSHPIVEIGNEGPRLVYFEPGANVLEVFDLAERAIVQSHAVDFEKKTMIRLGLAGAGDRFAVLAHVDAGLTERRHPRDWDATSVYVVDLGDDGDQGGSDGYDE